ncbi:MAG: DUF202 domain-containing protein [Asgard group archaeon]|nr:DUF202 domain-containing protein [Asgard group archaeon]
MPRRHYKENSDELTIRDHLAADRTSLANERTYLAYVRTSLAMAAAGFGLIKLFPGNLATYAIGWILISIGLIVFGFGTYRFFYFRREMKELEINDSDEEEKKQQKK